MGLLHSLKCSLAWRTSECACLFGIVLFAVVSNKIFVSYDHKSFPVYNLEDIDKLIM